MNYLQHKKLGKAWKPLKVLTKIRTSVCVFLTVKLVPGFFLLSPLFVPFRCWKWDFFSKLMSSFYGLIFCFSLQLFIFSLHTLALSNCFSAHSCSTLFYPGTHPFLSLPSPGSHSSSSSLGCGPVRLRVLWENWVPARAALSQISPLRSHSWPQGLNIERELRPWQSGEKTEGETDSNRYTRKIDSDKTPKACCTAREKETNIIKTVSMRA